MHIPYLMNYVFIYNMSTLKKKRQELVKSLRQQNREKIREGLRTIAMNRLGGTQMPLISTVLQPFCSFNHFQLTQNSQNLIATIQQTNFQQLTDQEHDEIVTDLFYLVHQKVINYPLLIKFKKNESSYTASLVAYLSADLDADQLVYWLLFMCQQDRQLTISMIQGDQECEKKWAANKKLFICLLQHLKWFAEAALVYKSMILNCEQLSKKDIDLSVQYICKGLIQSRKQQNEQLRVTLVGVLLNVIQIYFKLKQTKAKVLQLVSLLKKQLIYNIQIFTNSDILAELNKLYEVEPDMYLENDETCEYILAYIQNKLKNDQIPYKEEDFDYFFNNFFRMWYNQWLSAQLWNKDYRFSIKAKELIIKLGSAAVNNVWLKKLMNIMI